MRKLLCLLRLHLLSNAELIAVSSMVGGGWFWRNESKSGMTIVRGALLCDLNERQTRKVEALFQMRFATEASRLQAASLSPGLRQLIESSLKPSPTTHFAES